jgi:hypothetical protein
MSEEPKGKMVSGLRLGLPDDRSVFLGKYPADDDSYMIEFCNGEDKTPIRLSGEAIEAAFELYQRIKNPADGMVARWIQVLGDMAGADKAHTE